jgi:hypothetical protein
MNAADDGISDDPTSWPAARRRLPSLRALARQLSAVPAPASAGHVLMGHYRKVPSATVSEFANGCVGAKTTR